MFVQRFGSGLELNVHFLALTSVGKRVIRQPMTTPTRWPLLLLLVTVLGACRPSVPRPSSQFEWQKSSDLAEQFEDARQNCRVQTAAETSGMPQGAAVVGGDFVKCMRAAGWTLLDHGAK